MAKPLPRFPSYWVVVAVHACDTVCLYEGRRLHAYISGLDLPAGCVFVCRCQIHEMLQYILSNGVTRVSSSYILLL